MTVAHPTHQVTISITPDRVHYWCLVEKVKQECVFSHSLHINTDITLGTSRLCETFGIQMIVFSLMVLQDCIIKSWQLGQRLCVWSTCCDASIQKRPDVSQAHLSHQVLWVDNAWQITQYSDKIVPKLLVGKYVTQTDTKKDQFLTFSQLHVLQSTSVCNSRAELKVVGLTLIVPDRSFMFMLHTALSLNLVFALTRTVTLACRWWKKKCITLFCSIKRNHAVILRRVNKLSLQSCMLHLLFNLMTLRKSSFTEARP